MTKIYIKPMTTDFMKNMEATLTLNDKLTYLESVGSYFDQSLNTIYPAFDSGDCDYENPISLTEDKVSNDWWNALSDNDYEKININFKIK